MSSNEIPAETLSRLFLVPEAPLGQTWLQSASSPVSAESLHGLILASNTPLVVKARLMYGHFHTASSQMHKVAGICILYYEERQSAPTKNKSASIMK
jgi:hypothetical protein